MRRDQINHFMGLMATKTRALVYLKQHRRYVNPYDSLCITARDYAMPKGWKVVINRSDVLNPGFFERAYLRHEGASTPPAQ
jgi:hypothetical protein